MLLARIILIVLAFIYGCALPMLMLKLLFGASRELRRCRGYGLRWSDLWK